MTRMLAHIGVVITRVAHRMCRSLYRIVRARLVAAHRRRVSPQAGFALLVVTVSVAILGAVVGEFGYNARVDLEAAFNARDQLRAEQLARSGINLSRLLMKVQQKVIDPMPPNIKQLIGDIQITDFAPYLVKAFGGAEDEREGLGAMLGIDTKEIKNLGVGQGASFDVEIGAEDGKININCGGGLNPRGGGFLPGGFASPPPPGGMAPNQAAAITANTAWPDALYGVLTRMFAPLRYNRMFEDPDADGQYVTRDELARAIVDWSDGDENRMEWGGASGGAEDYRYDSRRDPYRARNNFYDTVEELRLVRGAKDEVYGAFGEMFTVYGGCKVNLNAIQQEHWPIAAAIIRACATNPLDSKLADEQIVAGLAQQTLGLSAMGGLTTASFTQMVSSGSAQGMLEQMMQRMLGSSGAAGSPPATTTTNNQNGIPISQACVDKLARVGPRYIYRIDSTGTVERPGGRKIQVKVRAIWDAFHPNMNDVSGDPNARQGTWVYWRME